MSRPIALFAPSLVGGGAERVLINLAEGLVARGLPVDIVLSEAKGTYLEQVPPGARVVDLRSGRVRWSLRPLANYLRTVRPRAIVSSMDHTNLAALFARGLSRSPTRVVVTVHNTFSAVFRTSPPWTRQAWTLLLRRFYPWADAVVTVSCGVADDLARATGLRRERIEVVYNPVITPGLLEAARGAADHPWLAPGEPPVVLGVGRLTRQKDFETLIQAFALVRRKRPARLIILGEGEDRARLTALAQDLGVNQDVALPGFVPNALAFMAHSAVFVLSSAWEGLPTVLIEALAAGTRVVSTDCESGPREILEDGRLGALVPVGDIEALATAIGSVLDGPQVPISMELLRRFTREAAVDHYLQLIEGRMAA
jgi:glycosyltransferase involved in cell wall biosynthesis